MKKILILIILLSTSEKSFSAEVNLNGLKIKLKDDLIYSTKYTKKTLNQYSSKGAGMSEENIKLGWKDLEAFGFNSTDKSLTIAPRKQFFKYMDEMLETPSGGPHAMELIRSCNAQSKSKKKAMECFLKRGGMSYYMEFSYASSNTNFESELKKLKGVKNFSKELKRYTQTQLNKKNLNIKKVKSVISANKDGDVYIQIRSRSKVFGSINQIQNGFIGVVNNKVLWSNSICYFKEACIKQDKEFISVFSQIFNLEGEVVSADLSKEEELIEFINTSKKAYRAAQIARILIMLL
jgi:hypothetical protein